MSFGVYAERLIIICFFIACRSTTANAIPHATNGSDAHHRLFPDASFHLNMNIVPPIAVLFSALFCISAVSLTVFYSLRLSRTSSATAATATAAATAAVTAAATALATANALSAASAEASDTGSAESKLEGNKKAPASASKLSRAPTLMEAIDESILHSVIDISRTVSGCDSSNLIHGSEAQPFLCKNNDSCSEQISYGSTCPSYVCIEPVCTVSIHGGPIKSDNGKMDSRIINREPELVTLDVSAQETLPGCVNEAKCFRPEHDGIAWNNLYSSPGNDYINGALAVLSIDPAKRDADAEVGANTAPGNTTESAPSCSDDQFLHRNFDITFFSDEESDAGETKKNSSAWSAEHYAYVEPPPFSLDGAPLAPGEPKFHQRPLVHQHHCQQQPPLTDMAEESFYDMVWNGDLEVIDMADARIEDKSESLFSSDSSRNRNVSYMVRRNPLN